MKIKEKGHTVIVRRNEGTLQEFVEKIESQYDQLKAFNLIIDLTHEQETITEEDLQVFEAIAEKQMEENKSFVLAVGGVDFNEFDEDLIVVPTIQEAHDLIEMDEIQRDLGF